MSDPITRIAQADWTWTVDDALAHHPCAPYDRARLEKLWAGRERLGAMDISELPIRLMDRLWALLRLGPWPRRREVWVPAIFGAADRAVRVYAPAKLRRLGREQDASRLENLPPIVDAESARAYTAYAANAADAAVYDAYAAYAAAYAASNADLCWRRHKATMAADAAAYAATYTATAANAADAAAYAAEMHCIIRDVAERIDAEAQRGEESDHGD